jgi:hypothetical protein
MRAFARESESIFPGIDPFGNTGAMCRNPMNG